MRWITLICLVLSSLIAIAVDSDLYRKNLALAPTNKKLCYDMITDLEAHGKDKKLLGFLGAYTMIKANHQLNPINKLSSFNKGKKILENAIKASPTDVELRYVRYAIQSSIPSFLGYNHNLSEDKELLQKQLSYCAPSLQSDIIKLIKLKATRI
ncbi:hypothetical protein [Sphingobacterium bovistauri]|uniref:Uncharacterized protein n=1 Tax=Sphingobacterium bovistauri TaxID=2781959 RepID=A0ABS7Z6H1_9SPHI|nr:hypothetical protein [Sphingobacterium bovistauri]MCA5005752.1 hypothetical protein [Sphingobacterium bovistauri]